MVATRSMTTKTQTPHYEFSGPIGVFFITFGLPVVCYAAAFLCNDVSGCPAPSLLHPSKLTLKKLKEEVAWPGVDGLINIEALVATLAYYTVSFILYAVLPQTEVQGTVLRSGGKLTYKFNAFETALVVLGIATAGTLLLGANFPLWTFITDNYVQLLTSNLLIAHALATYVYIQSFQVKALSEKRNDDRELAAGGHTGNMLYDWFIGRELNPPLWVPFIGNVDVKSFMELRPGMLGWILLNLASAAQQYRNYGYITDSMIIVVLTQGYYVLDGIYNEPAILTTIDITTDGFGFMLSFGDLVWLPFSYTWMARYLATHPVNLGYLSTSIIVGIYFSGMYIFRSANNEKNRFRTDPNDPRVSHLEYIQTKTGSRLITTGWWGRARHINYAGDWLMSWAYCLPTGIAGYIIQNSSPFHFKEPAGGALMRDDFSLTGGKEVVPGDAKGWGMIFTYWYMLYFAVLLIHRQQRDDEKCLKKYGEDWERYCKKVPWRIIPYVY